MNRTTPAVLALILSGCSSSAPSRPSKEQQTEQALAIVTALIVQETSQLKSGQWALYSVRSEGSTATASTRLAIVAAEGGKFWIENRTTMPAVSGQARTMIWKYEIDSAAKPLQIWVAEPPGKPAKVPMAPRSPTQDARANVEIAKERITIPATGKSYDCTRLTSKAAYPDGRETTLVTWCSDEVPFSAVHDGKSYGGVVRRTYGPHTLELTAKGTDAVPQLTLPEK